MGVSLQDMIGAGKQVAQFGQVLGHNCCAASTQLPKRNLSKDYRVTKNSLGKRHLRGSKVFCGTGYKWEGGGDVR